MKHNSHYFGNVGRIILRVINDIIPIILRNKTYGGPMKVFMYGILKAGTWAIMRYLARIMQRSFQWKNSR